MDSNKINKDLYKRKDVEKYFKMNTKDEFIKSINQ